MNSIGNNLKALRKEKNWTQEDLAFHSGVSRSAIASYESRDKKPKLDKLSKLAEALNVSIGRIDKYARVDIYSDCQKICDGLQDDAKTMLQRYKKLDYPAREEINLKVKSEWEKKCGTSGAGEVDMDHDKHASA
jgi:transcriptional regulator with XRE-family HTH domain